MLIFDSVRAALAAGYTILSPHADSDGNLLARTRTQRGWAIALVRMHA